MWEDGSSFKGKHQKKMCHFYNHNQECAAVFTSHYLKEISGNMIQPYLSQIAHRHCPLVDKKYSSVCQIKEAELDTFDPQMIWPVVSEKTNLYKSILNFNMLYFLLQYSFCVCEFACMFPLFPLLVCTMLFYVSLFFFINKLVHQPLGSLQVHLIYLNEQVCFVFFTFNVIGCT